MNARAFDSRFWRPAIAAALAVAAAIGPGCTDDTLDPPDPPDPPDPATQVAVSELRDSAGKEVSAADILRIIVNFNNWSRFSGSTACACLAWPVVPGANNGYWTGQVPTHVFKAGSGQALPAGLVGGRCTSGDMSTLLDKLARSLAQSGTCDAPRVCAQACYEVRKVRSEPETLVIRNSWPAS